MSIKAIGMACGLVAVSLVGFAAAVPARTSQAKDFIEPPQTVTVAPGRFEHALAGEFLSAGRLAPAPVVTVEIRKPVEIMRYQVSRVEYERCVKAGACEPADGQGPMRAPVTGVSHIDAEAYARWHSEGTGERWRLPTDEEWAFAAAEKFVADMEPTVDDPKNPARAWLSSYQREVDLGRKPDPRPKPAGYFGENSKGVADVAGNVWEWTSTCYVRTTLSADGRNAESEIKNCGVHVVEGFHRTYMSNFIRDGKSGGCAVGLPPDNLGFRLVREPPGFFGRLFASL